MSWIAHIIVYLKQVIKDMATVKTNQNKLEAKINALTVTVNDLKEQVSALYQAESSCCQMLNNKLDHILRILIPGPAVKFEIEIEFIPGENTNQGENTMAATKKASVDFQVLDNGTVKFTATPVDSVGNATTLKAGTPPLTWTSDNTALTLAADPNDASGFALSQIGTPTALATGVNVTCSTTQPGDSAPISGAATPVDIVAGPAGGFAVAEA